MTCAERRQFVAAAEMLRAAVAGVNLDAMDFASVADAALFGDSHNLLQGDYGGSHLKDDKPISSDPNCTPDDGSVFLELSVNLLDDRVDVGSLVQSSEGRALVRGQCDS